MMFQIFSVIIRSYLILAFYINISKSADAKCGGGDACIFVNKDIGWVGRNSTPINAPRIVSDSWKNSDATIFISISSFRDYLCPITLFKMFTMAKYPNRLRPAVIQQNAADDVDCFDRYCEMMAEAGNYAVGSRECPYSNIIKMKKIDASDARGPVWARAHASKLLEDEEYCLQIDSHMEFLPGWDVSMLEMWASTNNEYAILSTYVTDSNDINSIKDISKGLNGLHEVPHLCIVGFHGSGGMPRNFGTKCMRMFPSPKLTNAVWGAGLSFSKCHAERKVPYDPYVPGIFDGEEWSRAVRFWTYGYDIYTPNRVYISHNYKKSQVRESI
jgi:hypothetical protein